MRKFGIFLVLLAIFSSCDRKNKSDQDVTVVEATFDHQKMPARVEINQEASDVLDQWEEFGNLSKSFEILYQSRNNEDLNLASLSKQALESRKEPIDTQE